MNPIDPFALRAVLGLFATGIVVVTTVTADRRAIGMTVNSFTAVSLEPPLVLFCVNRTSRLHPAFAAASVFGVNILTDGQRDVSRQFSRPGFDRFDDLSPEFRWTGAPLIPASLARLECGTRKCVAVGDHDVIIGEVTALDVPNSTSPDPLLYFKGGYRILHTEPDWRSAILE